jgi:hypothetical protein
MQKISRTNLSSQWMMREWLLLIYRYTLQCGLEDLSMLPLHVECSHPRDNGIQSLEPIIKFFVKRLLRDRLSAWIDCELLVETLARRTISDSGLHQCTMSGLSHDTL